MEKLPQRKENEVGNKLSDFAIIKELGKGSYGTVYTVKSLINSNIYVMKKMILNHLKPKQQQECYREVSILKKVSHKNVIKYYSSFLDKEILYIIMEYAELGDLYSLIKHYKKHLKNFDEFNLWRIAYEILNGLEYLHSQNIIHRDIKCLNLFITKDHHIKIGDLGVSTMSINDMHYTRVGTPLYISPELVTQKPYDYKTDIWSFGCSLYHLAALEPPFSGGNLIVLGNNIVKGVPKSIPSQYSQDLKNFINKLLSKKPEDRPSAKEAKELIPRKILEKIKAGGEKIEIKSNRPFSSVGNKVITVNREEIRDLFNKEENNVKKGNNINVNNICNNFNRVKSSNDSGKFNIFSFNKKNNIFGRNNENKLKIAEGKTKEFESIHDEIKNKINSNNKENDNILENQKNEQKTETNIKNNNDKKINLNNVQNHKKHNDISFEIPSFTMQKGFRMFKASKLQKNGNFFENKFSALNFGSNKYNPNTNTNINYLKIFGNVFENDFFKQKTRSSKKHLLKYNNIIETNHKSSKSKADIPIITDNNTIKNINIIKIDNDEDNNLNKKDLKYPEIKLSEKQLSQSSNEKHSNFQASISQIKDNQNSFKRLVSAKNKERSFSNRPLTSTLSKISNKHFVHDKNRNMNNITTNTLKNNTAEKITLNIKNTFKNNIQGKNNKKLNYRPMTGINPKINNNIMNININFFNIDMNKRFLIPEINPIKDEQNENNCEDDSFLHAKKCKDDIINNMDLNNYKNSNEFLFQKIMKAIQDFNGNKRLTINDLN